MKLYIVAASEIFSKGLDPQFPYNQLNANGLLVVPTVTESGPPAILVSGVEPGTQSAPMVPANLQSDLETVEVPQEEIKQEKPETPVYAEEEKKLHVEEEKKLGKSPRGKKGNHKDFQG